MEAHASVGMLGMLRESPKGRPAHLYRGPTKVVVEKALGGLFAEAPDKFGAHQTKPHRSKHYSNGRLRFHHRFKHL